MNLPCHIRAMTTATIRPGVSNAYSPHYETVDRPANPSGRGYRVDNGAIARCKSCRRSFFVRALNEFGMCKECQWE